MSHRPVGFCARLWFAFLGVNRALDDAVQKQLHDWRGKFWGKVKEQHGSIRTPLLVLRVLWREAGALAWEVKDSVHAEARAGWIEGGHRHRELHELKQLKKEVGDKTHPDYQGARERILAERASRQKEYKIHATKLKRASLKGKKPPRVRDFVPPSEKPSRRATACCQHEGDEMACNCGCHPWNQPSPPDPLVKEDNQPVTDIQPKTVVHPEPTNGESTMTAPATTNAEAGITIPTLEAEYDTQIPAETSFLDQVTAMAADRQAAAEGFDGVLGQLSSAGHDDQTINEAAAVGEAYQDVAGKVEELKASVDAAVAALNTAKAGMRRHDAMVEAVNSHPGVAEKTAVYVQS
jgi:hypothetical protein